MNGNQKNLDNYCFTITFEKYQFDFFVDNLRQICHYGDN